LKRIDHFWVRISCFKFAFDLLVRFDGNLIVSGVVLNYEGKSHQYSTVLGWPQGKNPKKSHAKNSIKKKHQN
jgi:hypothetical protein